LLFVNCATKSVVRYQPGLMIVQCDAMSHVRTSASSSNPKTAAKPYMAMRTGSIEMERPVPGADRSRPSCRNSNRKGAEAIRLLFVGVSFGIINAQILKAAAFICQIVWNALCEGRFFIWQTKVKY